MQIVPLQATPSQRVQVILTNQNCRVEAYQKLSGFYLDLYVNDALVIGGVICEDRNRIVRDSYLGFAGDLAFFDVEGKQDPTFDGIGVRYFLAYLEPGDLDP